MTIVEIAKKARAGQEIRRLTSRRIFKFAEQKAGPLLLVDHYGMAGALYADDLAANDWDYLPQEEGANG